MTEIDPSLILKDGDCIYFHGEKYQKVEEPKSFYDKLWEELGKKVGYGIDCDQLTDRVMDLIKDNIPEPMDEVVERLIKKYQAQKLWNRVRDELGYSIDCCDEFVDLVESWLPEPQSAAGSQNVNTELLVEGFNDCVRKMKEKLR